MGIRTILMNVKKHKTGMTSVFLVAFFLLGIFLRTYHFREWMTFNPDQARDALVVQSVLDGRSPLPFLGPQAGNTAFKLGPMFYYFEIVSAGIFGSEAWKMAYPDLLFSILSIPLLFVFLRKFFTRNISAALAALYSVSFFAITYSRFAFNPNSIPFFTLLFLYGLVGVMNAGKKEDFRSAAAVGIAMGVGVQLHALLFLAMPLTAILVLGLLSSKKIFAWKSVLTASAFLLLFNFPQILGESRTGGANLHAFFSGAGSEAKITDNDRLWRNLSNDFICHVQGVANIAANTGSGDKCNLMNLPGRIQKKGWRNNVDNLVAVGIGGILFVGGAILWVLYLRRETDRRKRNFLMVGGFYLSVIFLIFIPVSASISIRYFISIAFAPYVFLGLWLRFIGERIPDRVALAVCVIVISGLAISNLNGIVVAASQYRAQRAGTVDTAVFGEVERMSAFVFDDVGPSGKVYLAGKKQYLKRFYMPLNYFAVQKGITLVKVENRKNLKSGGPLFYVAKRQSDKKDLPVPVEGHRSLEVGNFGNISLTRISNEDPGTVSEEWAR